MYTWRATRVARVWGTSPRCHFERGRQCFNFHFSATSLEHGQLKTFEFIVLPRSLQHRSISHCISAGDFGSLSAFLLGIPASPPAAITCTALRASTPRPRASGITSTRQKLPRLGIFHCISLLPRKEALTWKYYCI